VENSSRSVPAVAVAVKLLSPGTTPPLRLRLPWGMPVGETNAFESALPSWAAFLKRNPSYLRRKCNCELYLKRDVDTSTGHQDHVRHRRDGSNTTS
jgi:hypothetical protein